MLVGALFDDDSGTDSGSAYVFQRTGATWTQQAKLKATDGGPGHLFGWTGLSIDGNTIVVGAVFDDHAGARSGSAYIFERTGTTWIQQAKLTASDAAPDSYFGVAAALDADRLVIGARAHDTGAGPDAGSVYVFNRNATTWTQQVQLTASDAQAGDGFGFSVSIYADTIAVGAFAADTDAGADAGSVYIFDWNGAGWHETAKLVPDDAGAGDLFGYSVSLEGHTLVVGTPLDDHAGNDAGSAYVFRRIGTAWVQEAKLAASDAGAGDWFGAGHGVSIGDGIIVVGARFHDDVGSDSGAAYIFRRSGSIWTEDAKLTASDGQPGDLFGYSVAINAGTVVVGAAMDDDRAVDAGAAYVYQSSQAVAIDIKPGSDPNAINLKAKGVLPVAVLTTEEFDATTVDTSDLSMIRFGDVDLSEPSRVSPLRSGLEDVDGDGDTDLILHFSMPQIVDAGALAAGSTEAELTGFTADGTSIRGTDSVRIVPGSTNAAAAPVVALAESPPRRNAAGVLSGNPNEHGAPLDSQQLPVSAATYQPTAFLRPARHETFDAPAPELVDLALAELDEDFPAAVAAALAGPLLA